MRLLLYNIAYGTGTTGGLQSILAAYRYLRTGRGFLDHIIRFIERSKADIVGLVEIDTGSFRTGFMDQTELVARRLKHYRHCEVKYGRRSIGRRIPILRKQANAFFSLEKAAQSQVFYFPFGFKRMILELNLDGIRFFLVHLALNRRMRRRQMDYLVKLAAMNPGPLVIAGDFNVFGGEEEVRSLMDTLDLYDPNSENCPTFPSGNPRFKLDYILCTKDIRKISLEVPSVAFSDHLPVIFDFQYNPA